MSIYAGDCTCEDWKVGIESIKHLVFTAFLHGVTYDGPELMFCPYCGKALSASLNIGLEELR